MEIKYLIWDRNVNATCFRGSGSFYCQYSSGILRQGHENILGDTQAIAKKFEKQAKN